MGEYRDVNAPNPWERHKFSRVERLWAKDTDLSTGEDLIEAQSGIGFYETRGEWAWSIVGPGCPRSVLAIFVIRHDPMDGKLYTSIERPA